MARDTEHALSFGRNVGDYDRGRPGYPAEAVEWMLGEAGSATRPVSHVVDVGAGTGKFTAALVGHAFRVTAVEPDAQMRERLAANLPSVTAVQGTAEQLPLADGSAGLVTVAQAWHWVDVPVASREIARVLEPGGALALVWNIRDDRVDWVARVGEVLGQSAGEAFDSVTPPVSPPLERQAYREFAWVSEMSRPQFFAMVSSRSYVITMTARERHELMTRLEKLLDTHPQLAGLDSYPMPYVTRVTVARPLAR
jgi:ubiquinone/menaquinone biosynthesis C-methylase UbiE